MGVPIADSPTAAGDSFALCVRPEHLIEGATAGSPNLTATVNVVERLGESSLIHTHFDDNAIVVVRIPGGSPTIPGSSVTLSAPISALHVLAKYGKALALGGSLQGARSPALDSAETRP